jgi:hypothetical protein
MTVYGRKLLWVVQLREAASLQGGGLSLLDIFHLSTNDMNRAKVHFAEPVIKIVCTDTTINCTPVQTFCFSLSCFFL